MDLLHRYIIPSLTPVYNTCIYVCFFEFVHVSDLVNKTCALYVFGSDSLLANKVSFTILILLHAQSAVHAKT